MIRTIDRPFSFCALSAPRSRRGGERRGSRRSTPTRRPRTTIAKHARARPEGIPNYNSLASSQPQIGQTRACTHAVHVIFPSTSSPPSQSFLPFPPSQQSALDACNMLQLRRARPSNVIARQKAASCGPAARKIAVKECSSVIIISRAKKEEGGSSPGSSGACRPIRRHARSARLVAVQERVRVLLVRR